MSEQPTGAEFLVDSDLSSVDPQLDSIRAILFSAEQKRIQELEGALQAKEQELQKLQGEIGVLLDELQRIREGVDVVAGNVIPQVSAEMLTILAGTTTESRDEMAELFGPIIGDAIRIHIRDERQSMIDALSPVIIQSVQRAIAEFARNLQRNIDAQLREAFGARDLWRQFMARLRGISPAELALRDSLPFEVEQLFLIQNGTGLLLAAEHQETGEDDRSELIGGMLTAIRDFMRDSFGEGREQQELHEIQYGDAQIVVQSGQFVYLAVVIRGTEPEMMRDLMRDFISDVHINHRPVIRDYNGDTSTLPDFQTELVALKEDISMPRSLEK